MGAGASAQNVALPNIVVLEPKYSKPDVDAKSPRSTQAPSSDGSRRQTIDAMSPMSSGAASPRSFLVLDTATQYKNLDMSPRGAKTSLEKCHARWVHHLMRNPNLQVAVLGGGIYGCHFANVFKLACEKVKSLLKTQIGAKLVLFEKGDALFSQASGKNSFRIHKGFHYPRAGNTRRMCYDDHNKFKQMYPMFFQTALDENGEQIPAFAKVFAIAKDERTRIDYAAMRNLLIGAKYQGGSSMWDEIDGELWSEEIREGTGAELERQQMEELGFNADLIDGAFLVQVEPIMYADRPGQWFTDQFTNSEHVELAFGKKVDRSDVQDKNGRITVHCRSFDVALNCTYNQAIPVQPSGHKPFYDLCISVIVAEKRNDNRVPALSFGIFDGPFPSLEPYDFAEGDNLPDELKPFQGQNLFQIFDVAQSSIGQSDDAEDAYLLMAAWEEKKRSNCKEYRQIVHNILSSCEKYFPRLRTDFELAGTWFALKTKVENENATRPLVVMRDETVSPDGRFIQVFSSKLTSIFAAEESLLDLLGDKTINVSA